MTYVGSLRKGRFLLVLNQNTVMGCFETLDTAIDAARVHSTQINRGVYEVFEMGAPRLSGQVGEVLKWDSHKSEEHS